MVARTYVRVCVAMVHGYLGTRPANGRQVAELQVIAGAARIHEAFDVHAVWDPNGRPAQSCVSKRRMCTRPIAV